MTHIGTLNTENVMSRMLRTPRRTSATVWTVNKDRLLTCSTIRRPIWIGGGGGGIAFPKCARFARRVGRASKRVGSDKLLRAVGTGVALGVGSEADLAA